MAVVKLSPAPAANAANATAWTELTVAQPAGALTVAELRGAEGFPFFFVFCFVGRGV